MTLVSVAYCGFVCIDSSFLFRLVELFSMSFDDSYSSGFVLFISF